MVHWVNIGEHWWIFISHNLDNVQMLVEYWWLIIFAFSVASKINVIELHSHLAQDPNVSPQQSP